MTQKESTQTKCLCLINCKNSLKVINILFHGFLALLGVCIVLLAGIGLCTDVTYNLITTLSYFLNFRQCFGIAILSGFFLSLFGCFGVLSVVQGYHKRLSICLIFYLILIVLTLTIVLLTWSDKKINMETKLNDAIKNYNDTTMGRQLDSLQNLLGCCGTKNSGDYQTINKMFDDKKLPGSCCNANIKCPNTGVTQIEDKAKIYTIGCSDKINYLVWPIIYGICAGIDGIMLLAIIFIILLIFSAEGSSCLESNEDSDECCEDEEDVEEGKGNDEDGDGNEQAEGGDGGGDGQVVMQEQNITNEQEDDVEADETQKLNPQV